jgi:hypothetical protein
VKRAPIYLMKQDEYRGYMVEQLMFILRQLNIIDGRLTKLEKRKKKLRNRREA